MNEYEQTRREKISKLREMGVNPFGERFDDIETLATIRAKHDPANEEQIVRGAGRIVLWRDIGKLVFATIRDGSGKIQVGLAKQMLPDDWAMVKLVDLGDIIGVEGKLGKTKTGEITIWVTKLQLLSKATLPPPEKWHGLQDVELRYRQRYVDLFTNPDVMAVFIQRSRIMDEIRRFMHEEGYLEVETPMMQAIAGGAAARPFVTRHNALDMELFLRIAPELYLKRLLVGGLNKVFEVNRNFRNEGIDRRHNPEFTSMEVYQAYGDYMTMMELTENLIRRLALMVNPDGVIEWCGHKIDYAQPFRRITYAQRFVEVNGFELTEMEKVRLKAHELQINAANKDDMIVVNEVFEATAEEELIQPTFVMDYPSALSPLTRPKADNPAWCERWDLFIGAMEIGPAVRHEIIYNPIPAEQMFDSHQLHWQILLRNHLLTSLALLLRFDIQMPLLVQILVAGEPHESPVKADGVVLAVRFPVRIHLFLRQIDRAARLKKRRNQFP